MQASARSVAARVLERVWVSDAFAAKALDAELTRASGLDSRDMALTTELVYGVLRTQAALTQRIAGVAKNQRWTTQPLLRAHLLIAVYSLIFLDRIPAFAAVSEAVLEINKVCDPKVVAFANAVLRKVAMTLESAPKPSFVKTMVASTPGWLRGSLRQSLGRAGAEAFLSAGPVPPPLGICVAPAEDREHWIRTLKGVVPDAFIEAGQTSPYAILVRGAGDLRRLPGYDTAWIVKEEGAQTMALALGTGSTDRLLDACAGHGNKTWLLSRMTSNPGFVDAADAFPEKLAQAKHAGAQRIYAVDWTVGSGDVPDGYDRVLVDAPCSGVGTWRRRPEGVLRRDPTDLKRLSDLQVALVQRAATRVRDGGRLMYCVCTVLREECEQVVERLVGRHESLGVVLEPTPFDSEIGKRFAGSNATFRLLPQLHGTDGYFAAMFVVGRQPSGV